MGTKTDHKQKVWRSVLTDAPKIMVGTFSKKGTHLHDKNTKKIYGWFTGCCRGIVTGCEQTSDKTTRTSCKVKNVMSSGTTSLAGAAVRLRDVDVTDPDTRQYKFDIFAILHPTRKPTLQQPTTTLRETATHLRLSTHFTKVSRR